MQPRRPALGASAVLVLLAGAVGFGQQPVKPALPPINAAQARLDQTVEGLDGPGLGIACNEEANILAAACERGTVAYWDADVSMGVRTGTGAPHVLPAHQGPLTALAWSGAVLASAGADQKVHLWAMPEGQLLHKLAPGAVVRALAMSPDGKWLASGNDGGTVQLWDCATAKPGARFDGHADWIACLAFSADGTRLASGSYDGDVRLWDVASGKQTTILHPAPPPPSPPPATPEPPGLPRAVLSLAFSPDQKELAAGSADGQIYLFTLADGKQARLLTGHGSSVTGLAYHPTGTVLASASKDRTVRLWNPTNAQPLKTLEGHTSWVQGVVFLARGTRLASVGADQTVRLWDLAEPKK